jgi:hypothetical protein
MLFYVGLEQARNKIEALLLSHLRSFKGPPRYAVNSFVTAMPRVLDVGLEACHF